MGGVSVFFLTRDTKKMKKKNVVVFFSSGSLALTQNTYTLSLSLSHTHTHTHTHTFHTAGAGCTGARDRSSRTATVNSLPGAAVVGPLARREGRYAL